MNFFNFLRPIKKTNFNSKFNKKIELIEKNDNSKVIYVAGAEQTGGTITGMWQRALFLIKDNWKNSKNALVLGLGGGDVIRLVRSISPEMEIKAVDIDPEMIKIAQNYFNVKSSSKLKITLSDALYFMILNRKKFDLIIVDLFIGFKNPGKFRSIKFLKILKRSLSKEGIIVYNSHYHSDFNSEFEEFHALCNRVFSKVEILISYPYSRILLLKD